MENYEKDREISNTQHIPPPLPGYDVTQVCLQSQLKRLNIVCWQVGHRREKMRSLYSLEAGDCVEDWRDLAAKPKLADAVIVSTQDKDHKESIRPGLYTKESSTAEIKDHDIADN